MQPWRLMLHPELPGRRQMAIDEALVASLGPDSSPILRFYSWKTPALSLGRFQDHKKVVCEPFCVHNNIDVVRRLTGGRAVLHHWEVTYAVVAALDHGIFQNHSLQKTYRRIAEALSLGLNTMGVETALITLDTGTQPQHPRQGGGQCFVSLSRYEIGDNARKIIGSAQKRFHDRFLQHGSILIDFDPRLQSGCVQKPDPTIETRIAPLNGLLARSISFEEVTHSFTTAFHSALGVELVSDDLTPVEQRMSADLETVYAGENWTRAGCR